jgi:DNA-binding transcriptional LysR family regulator
LAGRCFAAKAPLTRVGFPWISLDSLVRSETYQWVTRKKRRKFFLGAFFVGKLGIALIEAMQLRGIGHGASLADILFFRNRLLTDIVAERYDAGVRLGEQAAKHMIAVRIGPDFRNAVVDAPSYFEGRPRPRTPHNLTEHSCINLRLPTSGGLWTWPFAKGGRELKVRTEGQLVFNTVSLMLHMAEAGLGLANLPEDVVHDHIEKGRLVRVLIDWSAPASGYHLYYPSRRQPTPAFALLLEKLRYRATPRAVRKF